MTLTDMIVTILTAIITAVIGYWGSYFVKNDRVLSALKILEPLAKDAVVASQKLGATKYLTGVVKRDHAVQAVTQALLNAGFTVKDEQVVINAVEKAYAQQVELLKNYPQVPKPTPTNEELEDAKALVAQKEAELATAKEKLASLNA